MKLKEQSREDRSGEEGKRRGYKGTCAATGSVKNTVKVLSRPGRLRVEGSVELNLATTAKPVRQLQPTWNLQRVSVQRPAPTRLEMKACDGKWSGARDQLESNSLLGAHKLGQ